MSGILTPEEVAEYDCCHPQSTMGVWLKKICDSHEKLRAELDVLNHAEQRAIDSGDAVAALIADCLYGEKKYRWSFGEGSGECVQLAKEAVEEIERLRARVKELES